MQELFINNKIIFSHWKTFHTKKYVYVKMKELKKKQEKIVHETTIRLSIKHV